MPNKNILPDNRPSLQVITLYIVLALTLTSIVYYLPNYFFLERIIADHSTTILQFSGLDVQLNVYGEKAFINDIRVVRECTGIQAIAVFMGLILPLPKVSWKRKGSVLIAIFPFVYISNLLRVVFEYWLLAKEILPWHLIHYPLSLLLGVIGVFLLVLISDKLMPQFGEFIFDAAQRARILFRHGNT